MGATVVGAMATMASASVVAVAAVAMTAMEGLGLQAVPAVVWLGAAKAAVVVAEMAMWVAVETAIMAEVTAAAAP